MSQVPAILPKGDTMTMYTQRQILPLMDIADFPLILTIKIMIFLLCHHINMIPLGIPPLPIFMITNNKLSHNYLLKDM